LISRKALTALALASVAAIVGAIGTVRFREIPNVVRADGSVLLFNGWAIKPAGRPIGLPGDMPLKMAFIEHGRKLLVAMGGFHNQGLALIDTASARLVDSMMLGNAWAGLAATDGRIYVSGGQGPLRSLTYDGSFRLRESFGGPASLGRSTSRRDYFAAGIAVRQGRVWVANTKGDSIMRFEGRPLRLVFERKFGYHPYSLLFSPDGRSLVAGDWGNGEVDYLDPETLDVQKSIKVGPHPNEMAFAPDGRLFVANGAENSVSVVRSGSVIETIRTSLDGRDLLGSTPDALAISPNGKRLFVANADNNDVAVVDISHTDSRVLGFIPTGWYPSALAISPDGKKLYIGTAKGNSFRGSYPSRTAFNLANALDTRSPLGPKFDYIGMMLSGNVNVVDVPDEKALARYTAQVTRNIPRPMQPTQALRECLHRIKHVFYVIRENRTYDEILGDVKKGNGDPSLVLLGQTITPNTHKLADEFVLLDNLYCNGEVSNSGHDWCDAAYCTDYSERAWENRYSKHGDIQADDRLDVSPNGNLWDSCKRRGISYRSYGERASSRGLVGHTSPEFQAAPIREQNGRDYKKVDIIIDELRQSETNNDWPRLTIIALPEDHTFALAPNRYTPEASVASNDLALGKLVDAVSHSKIWKDSAIFVIEDDTQAGPDHVDAHRTVGLVVSPLIRRHIVDSTLYSTMSMVRTMELILGLPPLTQYDEKATPMFGCFSVRPDFTPYNVQNELVPLDTMNPPSGALEAASARLDWSGIDRADPVEMSRILWQYRRPGQPFPVPNRGSALALCGGKSPED
jgi:YVTN family beta-propeller protein